MSTVGKQEITSFPDDMHDVFADARGVHDFRVIRNGLIGTHTLDQHRRRFVSKKSALRVSKKVAVK